MNNQKCQELPQPGIHNPLKRSLDGMSIWRRGVKTAVPRRVRGCFAVALALLLLWVAGGRSDAAPILQPFVTLPTGTGSPVKALPGPDGNWYGIISVGANGRGSFFRVTLSGSITILASISGNPNTLVSGTDGNFYGTTQYGGNNGEGSIFKVTTSGSLTDLADFDWSSGFSPNSLVAGPDGNFYGTTQNGGGGGTVFKVTPSGSLTHLADFDWSSTGYNPTSLIAGPDGNLYGTTQNGGVYGDGTVFKITTSGSLTDLADFNGSSPGYYPTSLVAGTDGNFYGTTQSGGVNYCGTVFKVTTSGSLTDLADFSWSTGYYPTSLVAGTDGNFYGTTQCGVNGYGYGTVFKVTTSGSLTHLADFTSSTVYSPSSLVAGTDGNIYGTTQSGGVDHGGTFFKLATSGSVTDLADFSPIQTVSALVTGSDGTIYGTTQNNGYNAGGNVFKVTTSGSLTYLAVLTASYGWNPSSLVVGTDGNLYGTMQSGGVNYYGMVFKVTTSGSLTHLADLDAFTGGSPRALASGTDGNLYGATQTFGPGDFGAVFSVTSSGNLTALQPFTGGLDGGRPSSNLVLGKDGNLYGGAGSTIYRIQFGAVTPTAVPVTGTAASFLNHSELVTGSINPGGKASTYAFEYGFDTYYGSSTDSFDAGNGKSPVAVALPLDSLDAGTTYHYRLVAVNADGVVTGQDQVFTTPYAPDVNLSDPLVWATSAVLYGSVNPEGWPTDYHFEYGLTGTFGSSTPVQSLVGGTTSVFVSSSIGNLVSGTTYYFTLVASSTIGTNYVYGYFDTPAMAILNSSPMVCVAGQVAPNTFIATNYEAVGYTATDLPTGLQVNGTTGIIYGTAQTSGSYDATINAIYAGGTVSTLLPVIVSAPGVITSPSSTSGTLGAPFAYSIATNNQPAYFGAAGLPAGLVLDASTGMIYGVPEATGTFSVTVTANSAMFNNPQAVAVDANGNLYIADTGNAVIRRLTAAGALETVAGLQGFPGSSDGDRFSARLGKVLSLVAHPDGNLYVVDAGVNPKDSISVRRVSPNGSILTLTAPYQFGYLSDIAVDSKGMLYVSDQVADTIYQVTTGGQISLFAGVPKLSGTANGPGLTAQFNLPAGLAVDANGNVFVADYKNFEIRKITPQGVVSVYSGFAGKPGIANGTVANSLFCAHSPIRFDNAGNLYVGEGHAPFYYDIRKITPNGTVSSLVGGAGEPEFADGVGTAARFNQPGGIAPDANGNLYVADSGYNVIRKVSVKDGSVITILGTPGVAGFSDGTGGFVTGTISLSILPLSQATISSPGSASGTSGVLFQYQILSSDQQVSFAADGLPLGLSVDRGSGVISGTPAKGGTSTVTVAATRPGGSVQFNVPSGVVVNASGVVYVADSQNQVIRQIAQNGEVSTLAGTPGVTGTADGPGSLASFNFPSGIALDSRGNVFVADSGNCTIRKVTPDGIVSTIAGTAETSGSANGPALAASFFYPTGIAVSPSTGVIYVADTLNETIRVISGGVVGTLAGTPGVRGSSDGPGSVATFTGPTGLTLDQSNNLYVADTGRHTIRQISPDGVVTTFAGSRTKGSSDGNRITQASFDGPGGLTFDSNGNLYVVDSQSATIRKIAGDGTVSTVCGTARVRGFVNQTGTAAQFKGPSGISADSQGNLYVADTGNNVLRKITGGTTVGTFAGTGVTGYQDSQQVVCKKNLILAIASGAFSQNATLSALSLSGGGLDPAFSPGVTSYTATVPNEVTSEVVSVTVSDSTASVTPASGWPLAVGWNVIPITVRAQDGSLKTYTIYIYRMPAATPAPVAAPTTLGPVSGVTYGDSGLNSSGGAVFVATVNGSGGGLQGIWTAPAGGGLSLLAQQGGVAPGAPGSVFASLGDPAINDLGQVVFMGTLSEPAGMSAELPKSSAAAMGAAVQSGVWSTVGGPLSLLAKSGGKAPNCPGAQFASFSKALLPNHGKTVIVGSLVRGRAGVNSANGRGIWVGNSAASMKLLIREGGAVTLNGQTKTMKSLPFFSLSSMRAPGPQTPTTAEAMAADTLGDGRFINDAGTMALVAKFNDGTSAIFTANQSKRCAAVAWKNGTAPGIKGGKFSAFGNPVIDENGKTAFRATVSGAGVRSANNLGIWSNGKLVARTGSSEPGGGVFAQLGNPVTNSLGGVAFQATLRSGETGIWWSQGKGLVRVATTQAPAAECNGALFQSFTHLVLPDRGGPLFSAVLVAGTGGVDGSNNVGLWGMNAAGQLRLIARMGEPMTDSHGIQRKVVAGPDFVAKPGTYTRAGDVIYKVTFDNGAQALFHAKLP